MKGGRAILVLDSTPTGSAISINGKPAGTTPYQGLEHTIGETLKIDIQNPLYKSFTGSITLDAATNRPSPIILQPGTGDLLLALNRFEENAKVLVDNKEVGIAPIKLSVPSGTRRIEIQIGDRLSKIHSVDVRDSQLTQAVIDMAAGTANITYVDKHKSSILIFDTLPSGIAIKVNGKAAGVTPFLGLHYSLRDNIKLEVTDSHFLPYETTVTIANDITKIKPVKLQKGEGQLTVSQQDLQASATVFINDVNKGPAPVLLTLPAGKHSVYL